MERVHIRLTKDRQDVMIPIDQIVVVYSRSRDQKQFQSNVGSISRVGLYKAILLNKRNFDKTGKYELVCGEGRLNAHKELGKTEIKANIIDCDETYALLCTLGENIARSPVDAIEFARRLQEMHAGGDSLETLSYVTGHTEAYLKKYLQLMANGEERLIKGVEDGIFPLNFALAIASSKDRSIQHLLMDAFDNNIVTCENIGRVRRIIEDRIEIGKSLAGGKRSAAPFTVEKLKTEIRNITRQKENYVYEAGQKENRIFTLLTALRQLQSDGIFAAMLKAENIAPEPQLRGNYAL